MGKIRDWFGSVKKVFSPEKKVDEQRTPKSKKNHGFGKSKSTEPQTDTPPETSPPRITVTAAAPPPPVVADEIEPTQSEHDQNRDVYAAALATAEAAVAAAKAAAEVVRLTTTARRLPGKSREEAAAIKIQTIFRGYLARRALQALRGRARLKLFMHGDTVKRQVASTLRCMQTLSRVQSEIRMRRIRMTEENQALQRPLQLRHERELEALRITFGNEWNASLQSKEKFEANIMNKHEAVIRRERALAYAFCRQWKNSSKSMNPMFIDQNNPQWGWSWMERWMAARPWESRSLVEIETGNESTRHSIGGETMGSYGQHDVGRDRPSSRARKRPAHRQSPSTPPSKASSTAGGRMKLTSPRGGWCPSDDDSRSIFSVRSERNRRHSTAGSSARDDDSLTSCPALPNYMTSTESTRAKSRLLSPSSDKIESVRKRLSFAAADKNSMLSSAGTRRHSGTDHFKAVPIHAERGAGNESGR